MHRRVLFPSLLLLSLLTSSAAPPAWWTGRGATNAQPPNDRAVVTQGQLKHFTRKAVDELNARIPGGAGAELNSLIQTWLAGHPDPDDSHAITSGQLKWIASKVHARLLAIRYHDPALPPWLPATPPATPNPTDKQLVNLGQLKTVFNFDLTAPAEQLPLWWQRFYFDGQTNIDPFADNDGDGWTHTQELTAGTDPKNQDSDGDGIPDSIDGQARVNIHQFLDGDGDGIPDENDPDPINPRGSPPSIVATNVSGNPVSHFIKDEIVKFAFTVSNPGGLMPNASDLKLLINGVPKPATITAIKDMPPSTRRFVLAWTASTTDGYPARSLQNLTLRFSDTQHAITTLNLARIDVAEWEGVIAAMGNNYFSYNSDVCTVSHSQGVKQAPNLLLAAFTNDWYRGPKTIPLVNENAIELGPKLQIGTERYPLFLITKSSTSSYQINQTLDISNPLVYTHNGNIYTNHRSVPLTMTLNDQLNTVIPAGQTVYQPIPETPQTGTPNIVVKGTSVVKGKTETVYNGVWETIPADRNYRQYLNYTLTGSSPYHMDAAYLLHAHVSARIIPHTAGAPDVPGLPISGRFYSFPYHASVYAPIILPVSLGAWHKIVLKVGPDAEAVSNGIGLWLRRGENGNAIPQIGFTLKIQNANGTLDNLVLPPDGKINLRSGDTNSQHYQQLLTPEGLTLYLQRDEMMTDSHFLSLELLKKREWYPQESVKIASLILIPVEVVELAPLVRDEDGNEDPFSMLPNKGKPPTPFVELNPVADRIAHRDLKVRIGEVLKGKTVTWTFDAVPGAASATIRGQRAATSANPSTTRNFSATHPDRFEHSTAYGANGFARISQASGRTTVADDGFTAIRVNVPPVGFNQVRIQIQIEGIATPIDLIDMEVPGVVVIDPGHGGTANEDGSSWNNATSPSGVLEKAMALDYGLALRDSLREIRSTERLNLRIFMTRETDINRRGDFRAAKARDNGADIINIIHFNAFTDTDGKPPDRSHTARGTLEVYRTTNNVFPEQDTILSEGIITRMVTAITPFDAGANHKDRVGSATSPAVSSDLNNGNTAAYCPVRTSYIEVEFIDFGAQTTDRGNDAVDILLNTGPNVGAVKTAIANAMRDGILHDLRNHQPQP